MTHCTLNPTAHNITLYSHMKAWDLTVLLASPLSTFAEVQRAEKGDRKRHSHMVSELTDALTFIAFLLQIYPHPQTGVDQHHPLPHKSLSAIVWHTVTGMTLSFNIISSFLTKHNCSQGRNFHTGQGDTSPSFKFVCYDFFNSTTSSPRRSTRTESSRCTF